MDAVLQSEGGLWREWPSYFQRKLAEGQKQKLYRNGHKTIGHALAENICDEKQFSDSVKEIVVPSLGPALDRVRGYALDKMRKNLNVACIGNGRNVDLISLEADDQEKGLTRDAKRAMGLVKIVENRVQKAQLTTNQRKAVGWFTPNAIKEIEHDTAE